MGVSLTIENRQVFLIVYMTKDKEDYNLAKKSDYATVNDAKTLQMVQANIRDLPPFVKSYFNSRLTTSAARTLLQYSYSLRKFFTWFQQSVPQLSEARLCDITLDDMSMLTARDIEEYMSFLQADPASPNSRSSVAQKIAALGSLTGYLYRHGDIAADPCPKVDRPKVVKDNRIVYLTDEEAIRLLDVIEYGDASIPEHQIKYLEKTRCRDLAIVTLMLNTGIRLSECVGLNIDDIDFNEAKMQVYRKGGKYQYLPLNSEVIEILRTYITERKRVVVTKKLDANALFLSMQNRRISGATIENMLRKYILMAGITKPITPHKLRKTYGTALYRKTRDIFMTANALGHENVATTSKHYVTDTEDSLRNVMEQVRVRGKTPAEAV